MDLPASVVLPMTRNGLAAMKTEIGESAGEAGRERMAEIHRDVREGVHFYVDASSKS